MTELARQSARPDKEMGSDLSYVREKERRRRRFNIEFFFLRASESEFSIGMMKKRRRMNECRMFGAKSPQRYMG